MIVLAAIARRTAHARVTVALAGVRIAHRIATTDRAARARHAPPTLRHRHGHGGIDADDARTARIGDGWMPKAGGALVALATGYVRPALALAGVAMARAPNGAERMALAFCEKTNERGDGNIKHG